MASIKDVAKEAGVGVATVSRVLNESGYVSADTKDKILKATVIPQKGGNGSGTYARCCTSTFW